MARDMSLHQICRRQCIRGIHTFTRGPRAQDSSSILSHGIDCIDLGSLREQAFSPGKPALLLASHSPKHVDHAIPAQSRWFKTLDAQDEHGRSSTVLNSSYIQKAVSEAARDRHAPYLLAYELTIDKCPSSYEPFASLWRSLVDEANRTDASDGFARLEAPWDLILEASGLLERACHTSPDERFHLPGIYVAQTKISDLPPILQQDLPTPRLVREAGKGDIYDSSIWLGLHPTVTPLHRDPNPNLFLQLAGRKHVRLMEPRHGAAIMQEVRSRLGASTGHSIRGEEMMSGPDAEALDELVWSDIRPIEEAHRTREAGSGPGWDVWLDPGDALFIPKGWWHSIKSLDTGDFIGSVNWWFR